MITNVSGWVLKVYVVSISHNPGTLYIQQYVCYYNLDSCICPAQTLLLVWVALQLQQMNINGASGKYNPTHKYEDLSSCSLACTPLYLPIITEALSAANPNKFKTGIDKLDITCNFFLNIPFAVTSVTSTKASNRSLTFSSFRSTYLTSMAIFFTKHLLFCQL